MRRLRQEDWLTVAKSLPEGGTVRIIHKGDGSSRPNLVVGHKVGEYWAYCHACGVGSNVPKTHCLTPTARPPADSGRLDLPTDVVPVSCMSRVEQVAIGELLASKGMDYLYLPRLAFSESRKRLIVDTGQGRFGRDTTGHSPQKWITYDGTKFLIAGRGQYSVVVEDLFSWYKVHWALRGQGVSVVCALGTHVRPALLLELSKADRVMFFYDGDEAGSSGATQGGRRVHAFGVPVVARCAPDGMDPKDMTINQIREHVLGWTL